MREVLEIGTFGGLRLRVGGCPVAPLDARSAEALLVYLAMQARPVPRDVLADLLWPDRDGERSRANLRSAVYRLRRLLPDHVRADRTAVGVEGAVEVDALELERRLRAGEVAEAAALFRGDFLAGFHLPESAEFEGWLASEAERLRTLALAAHQAAVERALAEGAADEALGRAAALLTLEPLHEPTHRVVLRLLRDAGRAPEALAHFEAFRRRLADDLGLEPDAATAHLAEAIRHGVGADRSGGGTAPEASLPAPSHGDPAAQSLDDVLPAYAGPFIGRERELATLLRRLGDRDCRWLTVTGLGGVGKTRLVVEAIRRLGHRASERTVFVPLAGLSRPHLLLPTLADAVGMRRRPMQELNAQLLAYLRDKRLLLVLDNLEHLADAVGSLVELFRRAPGVRVLATSRTRLHPSEEWLLPLGGLSAPRAGSSVFLSHASRVAREHDLSRSEAAIERICELVGGLPLAIELAASAVHALTPETIAAALEDDHTLLRAPRPDLPERHRSIELVVASAWAHLDARLAGVFARLAPFRGGFTSADAAIVAGASLGDLTELVDRSLLRANRDGRFELHELLRSSASARLAAMGDRDATQRAHAEAFAQKAERCRQEMLGSQVLHGVATFVSDRDNLRAALEWALTNGEAGLATRLIDAMAFGWRLTSAFTEARGWIDRALALPGRSARDAARLTYHAGHFAWMRGDFDEAEALLQAALDAVAPDEPFVRSQIRISLGMTCFVLRDVERGLRSLEVALRELDHSDASGARWFRAVAHAWRGKLLIMQRDGSGAGDALDTALRLFTELDNLWGLGLFIGAAAELRFQQGDLEAARHLGERGAVLLERVGFLHALAPNCTLLAAIADAAGDAEAAVRWRARAVSIYRELGDDASAAALLPDASRSVV
jgi:predicted ATPase/DNA-binding SARP family transcriptional activator